MTTKHLLGGQAPIIWKDYALDSGSFHIRLNLFKGVLAMDRWALSGHWCGNNWNWWTIIVLAFTLGASCSSR